MGWLPHVVAIGSAIVLALVFWPPKSNLQPWKPSTRIPAGFAEMRPETLAWKQPILPAQFAQGSCGACHRANLPETPRLNHGRQLIARLNCIGCHRLQDVDRPVMLGPDLTNVGTKVSREWIYKWLKDPRTITDADGNVTVDGVAMQPRMPKFQLSDLELRALSAYLSSQHAKPIGAHRLNTGHASASPGGGDAAEQGQITFNQLFCVTCHALAVDRGGETTLIGGDIGPELTKVGSKVKPEWLVAWLRDPQSYLEHTGMPRYEWTDKDLYQVSQYILTRLTDPDLLKDVPKLGSPTVEEVQFGQRLFVEKGCAECHVIQGVVPRSDFGPDLSALGMAAGPFLVEVKSTRSLPVRLHFVRGDVKQLEIGVSQIPRSMIAYLQAKITDPASVTPETHMPRFHLSQTDLDDLTTALLSMSGPPISGESEHQLIIERPHKEFHPDGEMGQLYHRFKCYQCHMFNGDGGTLAPDLSYEGSRSQRQWLVEFLKNPQTLRPTLTVRMPHFNMSDKDANTIADFLSSTLQNPNVHPDATDERELTTEMAAHGKQLFEEKYKCQSCHTIGSSGGYVGPSLNNAGNWLTPAWIEAWLDNPQALIPGVIEPRQAFTGDEKRDLTAYLMTLKQNQSGKSSSVEAAAGGQQ
jgi:mono/diheme cytochrome c family protein